ncbi:TonB-dependent receptor [Pseudoalteromonas luteoviolacea]|uniref:TonB-dependent receptor n=1 Tax=Pseudoalteromonas luteoviolacea TaxID=43657 RepID=UPI001B381AC2|nr:TonB-dependent receptor [Pseudoalteromonas luteoviolacea]MBQ4835635.1 TonB-dependent receptor [Pseudoalteromonas luteoviolacea]
MKSGFSYSLIAIALMQADLLYAQQQAEDIEQIIVTASRTAKANTDLALSVGSVSTDTIKNDNAQHVSESLETISGVLLNQLSGGQGHNAAIRMPINYGGYTLYLQDNVPLQSAAFYNHNALWWASSNSSISRLEVLKGAGTSLYGSGAVAATVNVISAPIGEGKNELASTLGEHGYQRVNGSITHELSNSNGIRISGAYLNNEGWREHSSVEKAEFNVLHELEIDDKQSLKTSLITSTLDQQMLNALTEEQFNLDPSQSGLPDEVLAIDPSRATDYVRLSSEYKYEDHDFYASVIPYLRYRSNDYIATWQPNMPKIESSVRTVGLLALTNFRHNPDFETTIGIDLERSEGDAYSYQPTTRTTTGWGAATYPQGHVFYNDSTRFVGVSPYIQHLGKLTEQLNYSIGLRYDNNQYDFDNTLSAYDDDGFGNRSIASRSDTFEHLSPKASLNYLLSEQSSVYVRYANAIRIPTASEIYHLKTKETSSQLDSISEETSDTYELGYKANFNKLSIELAYYIMDVKDAIVTAYDDFGASFRVNASEVRHQGFEIGGIYTFSPAWSVALAYSQSNHEFQHYVQDAGRVDFKTKESKEVDLSGNSLVMAPEYIANLRLNYASQFVSGLNITAEIKSIGDYWMNSENTRKYDGYTIANLKANYQVTEALKLHARLANVTDKKYALQAELRYGKERIQPGAPQMAYVGLSYSF